MAPKKKKTTVTEEILPEAEELFMPEDDALARAAEDLGANLSVVKVYLVPKNGKPEFLTEFASDDSDSIVYEVARRYGGGAYLARFYGADGIIQHAPVRFNVAAVVKPADDDDDAGAGGDSFKDKLLEKLLLKGFGGGGDTNPAAITAAIVQSATAQSAAMMQLIMPMIQQMMTNAKPRELPTELMAEMFHAGVEMASGKDDPSPMGLVERFAGILERVQRGQGTGTAAPAAPRAAALPAGGADGSGGGTGGGTVAAPAGEAVKPPGWLKMIQPYVDDLLVAAQDGVPASLVAAAIVDRAGATADWLAQQPPTFVESLLEAVPALKAHDAWTREVFVALQELYEDDGDDDAHGDVKFSEAVHDAPPPKKPKRPNLKVTE